MHRAYDYVTFDCYGTLVDWEEGIGSAFRRAAAEEGRDLDRQEVLAAYAEIEPIVESGAYRSYREVLRETAIRVARRFGWTVDAERAEFLPRSLADWRPFDDTLPALGRLKAAGYKLGILSNVDLDLLASTLRRLETDFDLIVTAQDVGSYKPHPAHFNEARQRIGASRWLHAAQSYFHDVVPAAGMELPVAWINRHGESPDGDARPDRELRNLTELADWLAPR